MEKLVSVIVPIYKVEAYLARAVDSILAQTYRNLEIILVDDGSPDRCGKICDGYAKRDNRITVIHKENGGLSDARNAGLDIAAGDYIAFVDSDDYIAPDFVETLLDALTKNEADVALCSYAVTQSTDLDEAVFAPAAAKGLQRDKQAQGGRKGDGHEADGGVEICDRKALLSNLYDANHRDATYFIVAWNKLYKASLFDGIRFPKGKIHEDEATTYRIYDRAAKGVYLRKPLYAYFSAPESITRAVFTKKRLDWMDALDDRIRYFEEKEEWEQAGFAKRARADGAIHYYYALREALPEERAEAKRLRQAVKSSIGREKPGYLLFWLSPGLYRIAACTDRDGKERLYQLCFLLLTLWLAFLCFYKLDVKYVDPWDESRHGVNAYEMLKEGKLIESTYLYETDYYNLKPPLSMWTIMLSMAVFGSTVFAMRLPSVLCYLALSLTVACFLRRHYGRGAALLGLALLSANTTPFLAHMVRAGDADSLYTLLFTAAMLLMMTSRKKQSSLYGCAFLFALAFLTKSFHAGVIVLIGGLYLLMTGELRRMKAACWIRFLASALLPIVLWGILRYLTDGTVFMRHMWETDVRGRTGKGFGSNEAGFGYYFSYYLGRMSGGLQIYLVILLLAVAAVVFWLFYQRKRTEGIKGWLRATLLRDDTVGFALWILVPTLAFSAVSTKLLWYLYPSVTALLIAAAAVLGSLAEAPALPRALGRTVFGGTLLLAGVYSLLLFATFRNYGAGGAYTNDFQLLIRETAKQDTLQCADVYLTLQEDAGGETVTDWAQQDVFVAEAYGDYLCVPGGVDALLQDLSTDREKEGGRLLFTTVRQFEEELLPMLEKEGVLVEVVGRRAQYLAAEVVGK